MNSQQPAVPTNSGSSAAQASPAVPSFFWHPVAWVVLVIAMAASAGGWFLARQHAELEARKRFDVEASRITSALWERMQIYQDVLHGAVGLFAASYSVERGEWKTYVESAAIEKRFPGVNGVGFVAYVPRNQLTNFVALTKQDGAPLFRVQDNGSTNDLFVIKYLEPEGKQRAQLGMDLAAQPEERAAAEKARDRGDTAISSNLALLERGRGPQAGFLMLLPVFRHKAPTGTIEERRAGIEGWVFARFITSQLMRGAVTNETAKLRFEVFDANGGGADELIFADAPQQLDEQPDFQPRFESEIDLPLAGRTWRLRFATTPAFEATLPRGSATVVAVSGALISLLLFGIVLSLSSTRYRAMAMAEKMTTTLRTTNEQLQQEAAERLRAEQSIKNSEALYHSLVESLPLQVLRKDMEGRFTFANQRFCAAMGKSLPDILGQTDAGLFPPELCRQHAQQDQQVLETGSPLEAIEDFPAPGGQPRYFQLLKTPMRDGAGNVVGLLSLRWDVTDKRRVEAALARERELLNTMLDNVPDRIYFKDAQSRFLRINRSLANLFGLSDPEQAVGKSDADFFGGEHAGQALEDEKRIMQTGKPMIGVVEKENLPDGGARWALTTKMPLRDKSGAIVGTFGISCDYTELKQAEEDLRHAKETAENASRAKSQFLASMSHELRTPLNSVIGFANILLKNRTGNITAAELNFLDRIVANGKHLLALINQILDLSKIEARKVELQLGSVALEALVRETIAQQESLTKDRPVELVAELPAVLAPLQTDADKLKQVLINLIGNALKFTERGRVTVRVVTAPGTNSPSRIEVSDTGIGIPKEKLGVIFQAFQQAEAGTARKYGGTGLGLTISQALCQLMGYRIEVTSQPGAGSTFSVVLTRPPETTVAGSATAVTPVPPLALIDPAAALKGKLVLVIDDELDSRTLLEHMIREFGCQVIAANSGEQGLHMAREFQPQLITVDLMMPLVDGWEVVRALKADPQLRAIPVVVVSVVARENRGQILGAVDVLQKPVGRDDLRAVLQRSLPSAKPKVLVVDDADDARRVLALQLEGVAAEVRTATNGQEALDVMRNFVPDLILLDLTMPVMDGPTFLDVIRADARYRQIAVVVVTARELTVEETTRLRQKTQQVLKKSDVFAHDLKRLLAGALIAEKPSPQEKTP